MQPTATDVAPSIMVCLSVCMSVCWAQEWALQKWLNRLRCSLEGWLMWDSNPCIRWEWRSEKSIAAAVGNKTVMWPLAKLIWTLGYLTYLPFWSCWLGWKRRNFEYNWSSFTCQIPFRMPKQQCYSKHWMEQTHHQLSFNN